MPGQVLQTDAFILLRRPPADSFQTTTVFSAEYGLLLVLQRAPKKPSSTGAIRKNAAPPALATDLFDEVALMIESSNQGRTWFVKEARLLTRHAAIGRSYEALLAASTLANLVARNPVHEDGRAQVASLLRSAFAAFETSQRPDIVLFKSFYRFARDEGYPVKQEWFPTLTSADQARVSTLLNQPLSAQTATAQEVSTMQQKLERYLQGNTEILLD